MRMRQDPGEAPDARCGGARRAFAHVRRPSTRRRWRDEQLGQIFRQHAATMKVSRETIARRLATSPSTIDNFEAGAVSALPHWKETEPDRARLLRAAARRPRADPLAHQRAPAGAGPGSRRPPRCRRRAGCPAAGRTAPRPQPAVRTERTETRAHAGPRAARRRAARAVCAERAGCARRRLGLSRRKRCRSRCIAPCLLPDRPKLPCARAWTTWCCLPRPGATG